MVEVSVNFLVRRRACRYYGPVGSLLIQFTSASVLRGRPVPLFQQSGHAVRHLVSPNGYQFIRTQQQVMTTKLYAKTGLGFHRAAVYLRPVRHTGVHVLEEDVQWRTKR